MKKDKQVLKEQIEKEKQYIAPKILKRGEYVNVSQRVGSIIEDIEEIPRPDLQVMSLSPSAILDHNETELIVKVKMKDLPKKC